MKKVCRISSKVLFIATVENHLISFHKKKELRDSWNGIKNIIG